VQQRRRRRQRLAGKRQQHLDHRREHRLDLRGEHQRRHQQRRRLGRGHLGQQRSLDFFFSAGTTSDAATSDTTTSDTTTSDTTTSDTTAGTTGAIEDCDALLAAFWAEVAEIRGCEEDKQCGQVLTGTSCGCTRNWIARLDADTSHFLALVDLAGELRCELPFISTCDCPEADGYRCDAGTCSWNYL
jgi:hypothetical protein